MLAFLSGPFSKIGWLFVFPICLCCWAGEGTSGLKTFGTMGKAVYPLKGGVEADLYSHLGKGALTHMWFGGNWEGYGKTRIRVYVDGEKTASINMELFMGHGMGFADDAGPWGTKRIGKTGHPSGVYNTYRIPFGKSVRVTAQLGDGVEGNPRFWYIVRGVENLPVEFSGVRLPDEARLRLHRLQDYHAKSLEEFALCDTSAAGVLYQVTIAAKSTKLQFLESCVRAYVDGSDEVLWLSSGLEDYFLGTYYFNRGMYQNDLAGLTHLDKAGSFSAYQISRGRSRVFRVGVEIDDSLRRGCRSEEVGSASDDLR